MGVYAGSQGGALAEEPEMLTLHLTWGRADEEISFLCHNLIPLPGPQIPPFLIPWELCLMILYSIWDLPPLLLAHLLQQGTLIVTGILKTLPGWIHGLKSHPAGTAVTVPTSPSGYSPVLLTGPSTWAFLSVPGLSRLSPLISSIMFMLMTHVPKWSFVHSIKIYGIPTLCQTSCQLGI